MRVLLSWLREFAPIAGEPAEIEAQLNALGLSVEQVAHLGAPPAGIIAARVLGLRPHPDADRIQLVDVDRGDGEPLQICCGAWNMAVGDVVPLATDGTTMADGREILARPLRGQLSNGMLCSARELELGDDHDGILILSPTVVPGVTVASALGLADDVVFDLDVTPNRPEALSVAGVARDLAAFQGVPFDPPAIPDLPDGLLVPGTGDVGVRIDDPTLCGRFVARVLRGVPQGPSPRWMARRLLAAGMRPVNAVVDVTNYVMLELGQPTHAFDLGKVTGRSMVVRAAVEGEQIRTLDDQVRTLAAGDGVVCAADGTPIAVAGIMGGASTEIDSDTTEVLLEAAWWNPVRVQVTASRLGLASEASKRFVRGGDPEMPGRAASRILALLAEIAGGSEATTGVRADAGLSVFAEGVDVDGDRPTATPIDLRVDRVNRVLGVGLDAATITGLIEPIGFVVAGTEPGGASSGGVLAVTPPSWRPDCVGEIDLIEEVARHHGYDHIERRSTTSAHTGGLDRAQLARRRVRATLVGMGFAEAMPSPFLAPGEMARFGLGDDGVRIANPLVAEESVLRTSLLCGLAKAVAYNASHQISEVAFFELGRVFPGGVMVDDPRHADRVLAGEAEHLAVIATDTDGVAAVGWADQVLDVLGLVPSLRTPAPGEPAIAGLHPTRSALIDVDGLEGVGQVGELDPAISESLGITGRVGWLQLDLTRLLVRPVPPVRARSVSRFPASDIDLAFVVPDTVPASAVRTAIGLGAERAGGAELVERVALFDVFRSDTLGAQHRSLAFACRFRAPDRTLTDDDVALLRTAVIDSVAQECGGELRS